LQEGVTALETSPVHASDIRPALRSFLASTWHVHLIHQLCHENDTAGLRALLDSRSISDSDSDSDSVSELLSLRNDRGWTALHVAVIMNRVEVIKVLISLGADFLASINAQGKYWIGLIFIIF
jgi:ankyrin repeat protein